MENTEIVFACFVAACVIALIAGAYCTFFKKDGMPMSQVHSDLPPSLPGTWCTTTTTNHVVGGPWYLVIYSRDPKDVLPIYIAADEILRLDYDDEGDIHIVYKPTGKDFGEREIDFTNKKKFEFCPASELGDFLFSDKDEEE